MPASSCSGSGLAYLLKDRIGEVGRLLEALREVSAGGSSSARRSSRRSVGGRPGDASLLKDLTPTVCATPENHSGPSPR